MREGTVIRLDDYRPAVKPEPSRAEMLTEAFMLLGQLENVELEATLENIRASADRRAAP